MKHILRLTPCLLLASCQIGPTDEAFAKLSYGPQIALIIMNGLDLPLFMIALAALIWAIQSDYLKVVNVNRTEVAAPEQEEEEEEES